MTKTQIFDDIVSIMRHDAACCKDEPGADAAAYSAKITDNMDDEAFLLVVQSYLATFHVMAHVQFTKRDRGMISFDVQRYGDALYIRETASNSLWLWAIGS